MNQDAIQKLNAAIEERVKYESAWAVILQGSQLPEHYHVLKKLQAARRRVARLLEAEWLTETKKLAEPQTEPAPRAEVEPLVPSSPH